MSAPRTISLLYYVIAVLITSATIDAEYPQQPKIYTRNGVLVLEAAYDRNINMRVSRDSSFLLNDIDIVEKIRQHYTPTTLDGGKTQQVDVPPFERIKDEVDSLKADIHGLQGRYTLLENGKRSSLKPREVRQRLAMLRRYGERLVELERNIAKDECAETVEPCKNGGTCYDTYKDFHCQCPDGWTGKACEEDVDECYLYSGTDLGCQNNAACKNIPGSYKCICSKGFSGAHCRLRSTRCDQSQSEELCGHGTCVPANNQLGYTCICDQGWTRNVTTTTNTTTSMSCDIDVNECDESRNPCHSECINLQGSFKCGSCPAGYTGNGVTCIDIDECANNNGGCSILPKVRCINTEGSFHCGNCPPGWIGDGHTCELTPSNSCDAEMICHHQAKCEYISDLATCTCPHGMFGHGFGPDGCHTTPITDTCENHLCKNNGTCLSAGRSTSCLCPIGYSGALCETADGCHPNPCENGGTCKALANQSFKCACSRGTTGKRCEVIRSVCASIQRWPAGELTYPSDGAAVYAPLERCAWIIRTNTSQILNLTFTSFDVEEDPECSHDWLQIHDGNSLASQLIGRFCGKDLPLGGNILSSQNQLFFWFRSDNATNRPGFHMKWQSQPHICGDTLELGVQDVGVIRSPGYPGKTPINRECQWELSAPYGYRFTIRMYEVNTGSNPNCKGDSLKLYDADLLLKEFCQSSEPQTLKTSSNKLKIHFHTDFYGTDSSFQLHYEVESSVPHCGGVFTEASGLIVGPTDESVCLYLIQQPVGTQIRLEFLDMGSFEVENCNLNSAEIFDGKTDDDESLSTICSAKTPDPIDSSSNYLLIRYKNKIQNEAQKRPFRAKYIRVCEFRLFGTDDVGVLTTPNYPNPYTEQITCTFHIYGPAGTTVHANFTDFSIAESRHPNLSDTEEVIPTRELNNQTSLAEQQDEFITYVDVYLSATNKRRYYKGSPLELISELNKMTIVFHATTNPTKARGLRVEYSFENIDCGGVYTTNRGSISQIAPDSRECIYIFEASEGKSIRFVLNILTENGKGHLRIYGNATEGRNYLLKNVSRTAIIEETFSFNVITIFASPHTHLIGSEYEFVDRTGVCGGNFSSLYGVIKSPNWPAAYASDMDCVWVITAPLGKRLELTVQNFTLESTCTGDVLEIRNGPLATSPLIGRYCGTEIPSRIPSFANSLYLRFTSDNYIEGPGFHITWEQTATGCGGKLTSYQGSIHSPYITTQENTDAIVPCDWQIHVAQGSSVTIQVTPYIDALVFCRSKRLTIYEGSSASNAMLSLNCSAVSTQGSFELVSSSNEVLIIYTPTYRTNPEFVLDYKTNCKMVLDHVQGVIESPNFPEPYPELLDCNWDIRAGENNNLKVAFSHLSLEASNMECEFDYVEIWDMMNEDILHKQHLCTEMPAPFTSDGNRVIVRFVTDYSNSKNGFRAEYSRVGCGEVFTNEFGTFHSPNYPYSVDVDCDWYIEVPAGKQIVFTLLEFKLEMEMDNVDCSTDYMVVKESKNDSISLLRECATQQMPSMVTSPSNHLYFHFRSGPSRALKGFKALYHTKEASCGGLYRASQGIITSPHYPQNITQEYKCRWEINVPESNNIVLNFKDFEMSESRNCSEASLTFTKLSGDAETLLEKYCGTEKPSIKRILNGRVAIEFTIKPSLGWGRFSLEFQKECGGIIMSGSGFIKSQAGENCLWAFNVPEGTMISLNILQLDCYCSKSASGDTSCTRGLMILKTPTSKTYCRQHQSNMMFEGPTLRISANLINFRAKYSTVQHSCGGGIISPSGSLASPYYPATYPSNVECTWTLRPAQGNSLQLQIEQMDIAASDHCNEDFLEVRNIFSKEILGVYCGNQLPDEVLTTYETVGIRFRSSEGSTGNGFKLKWTYGHLNDIVNRTQGVIESPPLTLVRNDEDPFAWRILVEREKYITLYFNQYMEGLNLFDGYDDTALPITISPSPWRFVSSSNVVYLKTDNDNLQYFLIKWNITNAKIIDTNTTQLQNLTELFIKPHSTIEVTSPGYPLGYGPNQRLYWIFKPFDITEHVICEVYEVKLELSDSCMVDYLKVSTSTDLVQWHEVEQLCNSTDKTYTPYRVIHGTPNVKLDFVTDTSVNRTGFMVRMKTKCGSNFTESVGFINGNKFVYEMECLWRITVKPSRRIRLQLDYAAIDKNNDNECRDYALIYDGLDEHAPLMAPGKICNPQNVSQLVMNSTSNYLTIKYALSLPRPLMPQRWNLTYREYAECNEEYRLIPDADSINITSPNYPNVPHPHTECEWRIVAPRGEIIQVEFVDRFDMNGRFCSSEFLELFDGSTNLARRLGHFCRKPPTLKTTQNVLYMRYLTDINEPRSGFKARISISKCGGSYTDLGGVIRSPGYPHPGSYPSSTQCDYAINLPADATIHFVVQDIHLPFSNQQNGLNDYLEIIPIGENFGDVQTLFIYGNTTKDTTFDLNSNKAIVRFHTFGKTTEYRGFSLKYNRFGGQCIQDVSGESGSLIMHFPKRSYYNSFCRWKITVPKGQRVRLEFLNLDDLKQQNATKYPNIGIFNDHEMISKLIAFDVTENDPHRVILATDNIMLVRIYVPQAEFQFKPLRARYTSDEVSQCPGNIGDDNRSGLIDIQDTQPVFSGNYYCIIRIKLSGEETLAFNITTFENTRNATAPKIYAPLVFRDSVTTTSYRENLTNVMQPHTQTSGFVRIMQSDLEHIHRLIMDYRRHRCGGQLRIRTELSWKQPEIEDVNYGPIMCVWTLAKPYWSGRVDSDYLMSGNFTFTDSCEREFVLIQEGQWRDKPASKKICRDNGEQLENYVFTNRLTYFIYQSQNYNSQATQFSISVQRLIVCGNEAKVTHVTSNVEVTKDTYKNKQECSWVFFTLPGFYLQLQFVDRFFIEDSPNCTKDYLEIQRFEDDLWMPDARFCGRTFPGTYNASTQRIRVVWHTDDAVTADGFSFFVRSQCVVTLNVTANVQRIVSPTGYGYGGRRLKCEYIFQSNETNKLINVRTTFTTSNYFTANHCASVGFVVYKRTADGDETEERHCENEFEQRAYKYLRYSYDSALVQKYTIEYSFDSCGGNITTSHTTIRPLKHETVNAYAHNMNCVWLVKAPADHSIAIRFKYFDTEAPFDAVSIYAGNKIQADKRQEKLSGNLTASPPTVVVDHNTAVITAVSDISSSAKGFEAQVIFLPACNERISLTDGNSPVTLARNFKLAAEEEYMCIYRVTAPKAHRIRIDIRKLQINNSTSSCTGSGTKCNMNCNAIDVLDSVAMQKADMGRFCTVPQTNYSLMSSYEDAVLKFSAKQAALYSFEILLTMEKTVCGDVMEYTLGEGEKYNFTFPQNVGQTYAPNIHCSWRFKAAYFMQLHFNYIDIQNASQVTGKCLDYIEVKGKYSSNQHCGHAVNYTTNVDRTDDFDVELTFHSDASVGGKGFEIIFYRGDTCNQTYNALSGTLTFMNLNTQSSVCNASIVVPLNYTLNLYVGNVYFNTFDCEKSHFKITDTTNGKVLLDRCQTVHMHIDVITTTNAVRLEASDFSSIYVFYTTSLRNSTPGCGGIVRNSEGYISSPQYENDRNFSECRWDIIVPAPNIVTLVFNDFNMGASTNCHLDNVKLIDILPDGSEKEFKTLCGPELQINFPGTIRGTSNHVALISKKSPNFDGIGWNLYFSIDRKYS